MQKMFCTFAVLKNLLRCRCLVCLPQRVRIIVGPGAAALSSDELQLDIDQHHQQLQYLPVSLDSSCKDLPYLGTLEAQAVDICDLTLATAD
jgi:hypothetical protein